jgi:predicted nucleic acid-binding protein
VRRVEEIIQASGIISVQVLNEFASEAARKLKMSLAEIREVLATTLASAWFPGSSVLWSEGMQHELVIDQHPRAALAGGLR